MTNKSKNASVSNDKMLKDYVEDPQSVVVPIIEEQLSVRKELVETGSVTLTKTITTETVEVPVDKTVEQIVVERREVNQLLDELPESVYTEGDKTVYRLVREVPVIVKKYEVYEEIVVSKSSESLNEVVQVDIQKEHITVDRNS